MSFVAVPADAIRQKLAAAGFRRMDPDGGVVVREEVWGRLHAKNPNYMVKVFTTIALGRLDVRGCGEDAIRVVALRFDRFNNKWVGLVALRFDRHKGTKVLRTGTVEKVLERMIDRARDAYAACNEHIKLVSQTVGGCDCPVFHGEHRSDKSFQHELGCSVRRGGGQ